MWACEHSGIYRADEYSDDESSSLFSGPGEVMVGRGEIVGSVFCQGGRNVIPWEWSGIFETIFQVNESRLLLTRAESDDWIRTEGTRSQRIELILSW